MIFVRDWYLGMAVVLASFTSFVLESFFKSSFGIWWGILGLGAVFQGLFILGKLFILGGHKRKIFAGLKGMVFLAAKLLWEIGYIWLGLKYFSSPVGLLIGGLLSLAGYFVWLKFYRQPST